MPPRPQIPADDLYARLELPSNASFEAIEIAWRALLKRHHPDVAGNDGLDAAKRINVAHDWLSDPTLRERYDRERHPERARRRAQDEWRDRASATPRPGRVVRRKALDPDEIVRRFLDRVARLSRDELDRLSVAPPISIAFAASIERFLSPQRVIAIQAIESRVRSVLPADRWAHPRTRDAILACAHELVLADFLDEHLAEPFRSRARDRLTRSWEAAVDQPRYGPNTPAVERFLARTGRMTPGELEQLLRASDGERLSPDPWPRVLDPDEDEALRVSAALASRDAQTVVRPALRDLERSRSARARRLVGRAAHAVALRHAFTAAEFAELVGPWAAATGDPATGRTPGHRVDPQVFRRA
jgi:curved DNA-binding protein CbpA